MLFHFIRDKRKTSASRPWTVSFTWNFPQEVFECFKHCLLCEGGAVVKNTRCVAELHVTNRNKLRNFFTSLANKYNHC